MARVVVTEFVTLDGVFEEPAWSGPYFNEELSSWQAANLAEADALLLGRTTYDIFRGYWPGKTDEIGRAFDRVPKYVASRGTPELSWDTSIQITDVGAEVRDLRARHEQIHTWGSANLLQTLFRETLVDQVNLWVCPVVIGQGKKLFPEGTTPTRFEQVEPPKSYPAGVMLLRYRCLEGPPETVS